jgi:hypothetical protein
MGELRGGIAEVNSIAHVQELREIEGHNNNSPSHYCIYENPAHGRLYVFFRGGAKLISSWLAIYSEIKLTSRDFDSLKINRSTLGDVTAIDPSVKSGINEAQNFEMEGTNREGIFQTFHMIADGYVAIDYKKVKGEYIVDRVELQIRDYIRGINAHDWPLN